MSRQSSLILGLVSPMLRPFNAGRAGVRPELRAVPVDWHRVPNVIRGRQRVAPAVQEVRRPAVHAGRVQQRRAGIARRAVQRLQVAKPAVYLLPNRC